MNDGQFIQALINLASTVGTLDEAEKMAAIDLKRLANTDYPKDGCAITASELLRMAGIEVPLTCVALDLDNLLQKRGWQKIAPGQQKAGDLGSTCHGGVRHPGDDHIFTVCYDLNPQEMIVADNQSAWPHQRRTDGKDGKTPTNHFLRASG